MCGVCVREWSMCVCEGVEDVCACESVRGEGMYNINLCECECEGVEGCKIMSM